MGTNKAHVTPFYQHISMNFWMAAFVPILAPSTGKQALSGTRHANLFVGTDRLQNFEFGSSLSGDGKGGVAWPSMLSIAAGHSQRVGSLRIYLCAWYNTRNGHLAVNYSLLDGTEQQISAGISSSRSPPLSPPPSQSKTVQMIKNVCHCMCQKKDDSAKFFIWGCSMSIQQQN